MVCPYTADNFHEDMEEDVPDEEIWKPPTIPVVERKRRDSGRPEVEEVREPVRVPDPVKLVENIPAWDWPDLVPVTGPERTGVGKAGLPFGEFLAPPKGMQKALTLAQEIGKAVRGEWIPEPATRVHLGGQSLDAAMVEDMLAIHTAQAMSRTPRVGYDLVKKTEVIQDVVKRVVAPEGDAWNYTPYVVAAATAAASYGAFRLIKTGIKTGGGKAGGGGGYFSNFGEFITDSMTGGARAP